MFTKFRKVVILMVSYMIINFNIYINDNTLPNIKNANRDLLYTPLYNKLVASNFINYINLYNSNSNIQMFNTNRYIR